MNAKKRIALLMTAVLLISILSGCSGAASKDSVAESPNFAGDMDYMADMEYGSAAEGIYDSASDSKTEAITDRKLIRKIELDTETEDLDALLAAVDSKVAALGGYMENREVYAGSAYSSYSSVRHADLTIRIPKDRLDEFVDHVENASNVTSCSESADDVTLSYVATQSRMTALQKEEARLLSLIDEAASLTELLELEKRLTEVRTDLENVTSQLLLYDNLVDYGTVTVSIREVQKLTPVEEPGFWQRLGEGFLNSVNNLWEFLKEFAIFLVCAIPYLVPMGVIALVIVLIIRASIRRRRRKAKRQPPFQTENDK